MILKDPRITADICLFSTRSPYKRRQTLRYCDFHCKFSSVSHRINLTFKEFPFIKRSQEPEPFYFESVIFGLMLVRVKIGNLDFDFQVCKVVVVVYSSSLFFHKILALCYSPYHNVPGSSPIGNLLFLSAL